MYTMANIDAINKFFTDIKEIFSNSFADFEQQFSMLKNGYYKLLDDYRETNKTLAEDFNVFRILGAEHYEVYTHSAILRELLDSNGTHGQGNLFFKEFLSMLASKRIIDAPEVEACSPKTFDDYLCEAERSVETGRIDIILERLEGDFPFCLIIENKIWAEDQEKQIERYWQELDSKKSVPISRKKILYLSLDGHLPSEWSIDNSVRQELEGKNVLHCISYKKDIKQWLENVLPKIESQKVKHTVEQYVNVIDSLGGSMSKLFDEKICEFLTQSNNWSIAKEIFEKMPAIPEQLRNKFWMDVRSVLEKKINPAEWKIIGPGVIDSNKYNSDSGLCITKLSWQNLFLIGFGSIGGQTYLAVWCDSDSEKVKSQYNYIADELIKSGKNLTKDPLWFPAWFFTGDNFGEWSTTDRILPHNRNVMVEKYISMLFELTEKAKVVIDGVVNRL